MMQYLIEVLFSRQNITNMKKISCLGLCVIIQFLHVKEKE